MSNKTAVIFAVILRVFTLSYRNIWEFLVRVIGLEPTRPKAPEPKSGASTNFAIAANIGERQYFQIGVYVNRLEDS